MTFGQEDINNNHEVLCQNDVKNSQEGFGQEEDSRNIEELVICTNNVNNEIDKIKEVIKNNRVVILRGNTGCGKTTNIPLALLKDYKNIVCTQPRQLAAISVAKRVAFLDKSKLGNKIGFAVRFYQKISNRTKLRYVTDGILLKELIPLSSKGEDKLRYDLIIIDEAHERSLNIDILLGFLKNNFKKTKLLIMSATLDSKKLCDFFSCPFITLKHEKFFIKENYLQQPCQDYHKEAIETVVKILGKYNSGNILVFMPGTQEIKKAVTLAQGFLEGTGVSVFPLYSKMDYFQQQKVLDEKKRKVIFSTNVAETSITINDIKFVVDSGYVNAIRFQSEDNSVTGLEKINISRSQAKQRAGRAGRTASGHVFRLYTKNEFENWDENTTPQIMHTSVIDIVLSLLTLGVKDVYKFDWIDAPDKIRVEEAMNYLYTLKAIDEFGKITKFGLQVASLPLTSKLGVTLLYAKTLGCLKKSIVISAFLENLPLFQDISTDSKMYRKMVAAKNCFEDKKGDFYYFLDIWEKWSNNDFSKKFLHYNFLKVNTFFRIKSTVDQIMRLSLFKNYKWEQEGDCGIEQAFSYGFYYNVAISKKHTKYLALSSGISCRIHHLDSLAKKYPPLVIFCELFRLNEEYTILNCLEISKENLEKVAEELE